MVEVPTDCVTQMIQEWPHNTRFGVMARFQSQNQQFRLLFRTYMGLL